MDFLSHKQDLQCINISDHNDRKLFSSVQNIYGALFWEKKQNKNKNKSNKKKKKKKKESSCLSISTTTLWIVTLDLPRRQKRDLCTGLRTLGSISATLTGGNWQKWKRVLLTCPCHKIYRDEAVGLKSCKYTWKITIFVKMWNLGQYLENLIFCQ